MRLKTQVQTHTIPDPMCQKPLAKQHSQTCRKATANSLNDRGPEHPNRQPTTIVLQESWPQLANRKRKCTSPSACYPIEGRCRALSRLHTPARVQGFEQNSLANASFKWWLSLTINRKAFGNERMCQVNSPLEVGNWIVQPACDQSSSNDRRRAAVNILIIVKWFCPQT